MPDDQEPVLNKEAALELCDDEDLFLEIVQAYLENAMEPSKDLLYALEQSMLIRRKNGHML